MIEGSLDRKKKKVERPLPEAIRTRALEAIQDIMDLPEKDRIYMYSRRKDTLRELILDLKSFQEMGPVVDRKIPEDTDDEEAWDFEERSDPQPIVDQHYPGYTIEDLRTLERMLPEGVSKTHAMAQIVESVLLGLRMKLFLAKTPNERQRIIDIELNDLTLESLSSRFDRSNAFLAQLTDTDFGTIADFIKNNRDLPPAKVLEAMMREFGEK